MRVEDGGENDPGQITLCDPSSRWFFRIARQAKIDQPEPAIGGHLGISGHKSMTQTLAEILLFASVAINAALLIFIAGVLGNVMNDMDELEFKYFVESLYRHSTKSPFMLTVLNMPFVGAIPYFYFYGSGNQWITAGLAIWLIAGIIAKAIKVPVYKTIAAAGGGEVLRLREERRKLNAGNLLQAILNLVAAAVMIIAFVR